VLLARHFGLDEPEPPCGACDACTDADEWRAQHMSARSAGSATARAPGSDAAQRDTRVQRGDWVTAGRDLGQVVQARGAGDRLRIVIEDARTLERRTTDPRKRPVRRLEPGER
jgi:hypothetical protein